MGVEKNILQQVCPVTSGNECALTETAFVRMCAHYREYVAEGNSRRVLECSRYLCSTCQGKSRPEELSIIDLNNEQGNCVMATATKKTETCQCCGRSVPKVYAHYGKNVCSRCQTVRGVVKSNPQLVQQFLEEFGTTTVAADTGALRETLQEEQQQVRNLETEVERLGELLTESLESVTELETEKANQRDRIKLALDDVKDRDRTIEEMGEELEQMSKVLAHYESGDRKAGGENTADRHAIKSLGLRMAIGLIEEAPFHYTVDDVKLLDGV